MDISTLKIWLIDAKNKRAKIDNDILHLEALIASNEEQKTNISHNLVIQPAFEIKPSDKINKGKIIVNACEKMLAKFSSTSIKEVLSSSENEEIKKISLGYISHMLGKLEKKGEIFLVEKGTGRGSPNYYSMKKENIIDQSLNNKEEI